MAGSIFAADGAVHIPWGSHRPRPGEAWAFRQVEGHDEEIEVAEQLRLMAVHAHPDDESSKGAATMARYVAEGVQVLVVTCTGGERGSVLNPKMDRPEVLADITNIRRAEMDAARAILGVDQAWLGFVDSGLPEGDPLPPLPEGCFGLMDPDEAAIPLIRLMREFRPHVVTTYDENGGYPHPDHIMCHKVTVAAFDAAADPETHPELGEPWQPLKLYYNSGWTKARMLALHEGMLAEGLESPYTEWIEKWADRDDRGDKITTRVECGEYFEIRDNALRAHATQVDPDGFWFHMPMELQIKIWPTEDFELARSMVDSPVPESDLFAGVRETVQAH
jgi:mycothiol S-conjugate amidase